jgi:O-antigen/teichoic acid export membrane protein
VSAAAKAAGAAQVMAKLKRRALSLGAVKAFDYAMQFLLPVVLVRCLDSVTFGEYRLLWLIIATVMVIATFNMAGSLYFFLPRSQPETKQIYITQTIAFLGVAGLVAAWAVSPWNPLLPSALKPMEQYGALVPAFVSLWVTAYLLDMLPTIDERLPWQACVTIGLSVLRVVLLSVGAFLTGDLQVLLWLLLALVVLKLAILLVYVARIHGLVRPRFDRALFAGQFRHAAPIGMSNGMFGLRAQADQWVAAYLFSLGSFAAFTIAAVLSPLVNLFRSSVNEAFLPSMSRMQAAGDLRGMLELNSRANVMVGTLLYPILAFAFVFAEEIVTVVYTATYIEAAAVMRLYIVGLVPMVIEVGSMILLLREGETALRVNTAVLAIAVLVSLGAALQFGLVGAAAGSVIGVYLDRSVLLRRIALRVGIPLRRLQDWRALLLAGIFATLAAILAWGVVDVFFGGKGMFVRLAIGAAVLAASYAAVPALFALGRRAEPGLVK